MGGDPKSTLFGVGGTPFYKYIYIYIYIYKYEVGGGPAPRDPGHPGTLLSENSRPGKWKSGRKSENLAQKPEIWPFPTFLSGFSGIPVPKPKKPPKVGKVVQSGQKKWPKSTSF